MTECQEGLDVVVLVSRGGVIFLVFLGYSRLGRFDLTWGPCGGRGSWGGQVRIRVWRVLGWDAVPEGTCRHLPVYGRRHPK